MVSYPQNKENRFNYKSRKLPFITVVVPCYNEEVWIDKLISALENQTYSNDQYEIIVVDNNSTDRTREIVQRHQVKLLIEEKRSSYRARNNGVRNAFGEYIAFIDADCLPDLDWLNNLIDTALQYKCSFVAGRIENNIVKNNFANILLSIRKSPKHRRDAVINDVHVACGNMMVAKSLFKKHGLFNNFISGSDIEFSKRVTKAGDQIVYSENAKVSHQCDLSNTEFLRRAFRIRYGQELNKRNGNYLNRFWINLFSVPWRPGIRASFEIVKPQSIMELGRVITLWIYLWVERWFAYFGGIFGAIKRLKMDG